MGFLSLFQSGAKYFDKKSILNAITVPTANVQRTETEFSAKKEASLSRTIHVRHLSILP